MKMVGLEDFIRSFGNRATRLSMNMDYYFQQFQCACGKKHDMGNYLHIPMQGFQKVLVVCPDNDKYLTNVAIKMKFLIKFDRFESICGTYLSDLDDQAAFDITMNCLK